MSACAAKERVGSLVCCRRPPSGMVQRRTRPSSHATYRNKAKLMSRNLAFKLFLTASRRPSKGSKPKSITLQPLIRTGVTCWNMCILGVGCFLKSGIMNFNEVRSLRVVYCRGHTQVCTFKRTPIFYQEKYKIPGKSTHFCSFVA